jgi:hypothetical protein
LHKAYCDLSRSSRVSLVAGYIGTAEQWDWLEREWKRNLAYWELEDFHLAELPNMMGHEKADLCILSFGHLIKKSDVRGISAGVENAFYESQVWGANFPSAYHVCVDMLLDSLNTHIPLNMGGGCVDLVFDRDTNAQNEVLNLLTRYDANTFRSLTFSDRKKTLPLQTADLAAGVVRKGWVEDNFFNGLPKSAGLLSNVLGERHFGVALSFETDRVVRAARARMGFAQPT